MDSNLYQKPEFLRYGLAQLLGDGRTFRQRSATYFTDYHWILGLLGVVQIRELTEIFIDKSIEVIQSSTCNFSFKSRTC